MRPCYYEKSALPYIVYSITICIFSIHQLFRNFGESDKMVKGGEKRTPHQYLEDILSRALLLGLISKDEMARLLEDEAESIQDSIDSWRPLVREAENEPKRDWVVTTTAFLCGKEVNERVDDVVFTVYSDACDWCRLMNATTVTSPTKSKKCRVVELKDSIAFGAGEGRSCFQLLEITPADRDSALTAGSSVIDWDGLLGHGNGYLSLRNKNVVAADVPGIISCVVLAEGLVTQLGLSQNSLKQAGAVALASELLRPVACFQHISALFLSNNNIGDEGAIVVADLIVSRLLPLVKLGLNSNDITDVGAIAVAAALEDGEGRPSIMEVLGLSHNHITSVGAARVAAAVKKNSSLQRLFLNYNPGIGDQGGVALAAAATRHPSLLRLGVASCALRDCSGEALLEAMCATDSLERICVGLNCFGEETEKRMEEISRFNFSEVK